jgi:hypothetical protein
VFFAPEKRASIHHVSPHISPAIHHENATFFARFFQNTPQKPQQKQQNPGFRRGSVFFPIFKTLS